MRPLDCGGLRRTRSVATRQEQRPPVMDGVDHVRLPIGPQLNQNVHPHRNQRGIHAGVAETFPEIEDLPRSLAAPITEVNGALRCFCRSRISISRMRLFSMKKADQCPPVWPPWRPLWPRRRAQCVAGLRPTCGMNAPHRSLVARNVAGTPPPAALLDRLAAGVADAFDDAGFGVRSGAGRRSGRVRGRAPGQRRGAATPVRPCWPRSPGSRRTYRHSIQGKRSQVRASGGGWVVPLGPGRATGSRLAALMIASTVGPATPGPARWRTSSCPR